jgi:hypothetical protein
MGDMKKRRNRLVEWMIDWDKRHWGHDFVGSSTLGIATIFIAALAGMVLTILEGGFDDVFFVYAVMLILVVVIESVLSAKSVKTAVGRSLVMSFAVSLAMLAGIVAVIGALVALVVMNLTASGPAVGRRKSIDGEEVEESRDLLGFDRTYKSTSSDRSWRSTDGGNTATEQ